MSQKTSSPVTLEALKSVFEGRLVRLTNLMMNDSYVGVCTSIEAENHGVSVKLNSISLGLVFTPSSLEGGVATEEFEYGEESSSLQMRPSCRLELVLTDEMFAKLGRFSYNFAKTFGYCALSSEAWNLAVLDLLRQSHELTTSIFGK